MQKKILALVVAIPLVCLSMAFAYNLPFVHDHLAWRVDNLKAQVQYALNPPEQVVFVPQPQVTTIMRITQPPVPTSTPYPTPTPTLVGPTETPSPSATLSPSSTPLPDKFSLSGIVHEYQKWNNCGPANLAMDLSFWKWGGDQSDTAAVLKPNLRDKNVMPYEMVDYVQNNTDLKALARVGGDLQMLKDFLAAGFPVIVEKGFEGPSFDGWMGHYEVVNGYNDAKSSFTVQDSYLGPNLSIPYDQMESNFLGLKPMKRPTTNMPLKRLLMRYMPQRGATSSSPGTIVAPAWSACRIMAGQPRRLTRRLPCTPLFRKSHAPGACSGTRPALTSPISMWGDTTMF
jgi:hypothetical protein